MGAVLAGPWEPLVVLPSQFVERGQWAQCPELGLVAAILDDAVHSVLHHAGARRGPRRRQFLEACEWFRDDSRDWLFSFVNVCEILGLDADAVRQRQRPAIGTDT